MNPKLFTLWPATEIYVMSTRCQSSRTVSGAHAWWTTISRHYSRQVFPVYCEDMADSSGSSSFSSATPGPQSSIDELVFGLLENPHFQDVLERTTRRTHRSPSLQANQPATGSTTSRPVFQTPVEEFRSLFRAGTSSSQGQNTSMPRFRRFYQRPRGRAYASRTRSHTATSATSTNASTRVDKQTPFCREVVLLNRPHDQTVLRGSRKASLHRTGNVLSAFQFSRGWSAEEVYSNLEGAFPQLVNIQEEPK